MSDNHYSYRIHPAICFARVGNAPDAWYLEPTADQALDGGQMLGQNVLYHRGLNSFLDAVVGWKYLGFVLNRATGAHRDMFRFFMEQERSYAAFQAGSYGLTPEGQLYTTQPSTTTNANVNTQSQNVVPLQWLVGN